MFNPPYCELYVLKNEAANTKNPSRALKNLLIEYLTLIENGLVVFESIEDNERNIYF